MVKAIGHYIHKLSAIFVLVLCIALPCDVSAQSLFDGVWFAETSPWNVPIGDARIMDYSASVVQAFARTNHLNMNEWNIWTPAVIYGDSSVDRTQDVVFNDGLGHPWRLRKVPIPQTLIDYAKYRVARNDTDGMTCLYDEHKKGFYSFWQPSTDGTTISITTGGFSPISGPGWSAYATHSPFRLTDTPSLGRAAGANYCGGIIRASELAAGHIDHAVAVLWPVDLMLGWKARNPLQYPATSTDGNSIDPTTSAPYGARIQLDPSLTDGQLASLGLNSVDLVVAHALQKYGGYIVDTGPVASITFENRMQGNNNEYGATSTWPRAVYRHFRFVEPPAVVKLDTAAGVGAPIP